MTDPEAWDEPDPRVGVNLVNRAGYRCACALVWLLTAPFQLIANLNRRDHATQNDARGANCDAGVEGRLVSHSERPSR